MNKEYLADGVYVQDDGFQLELSAEASEYVNLIYLDDTVLTALFKYVEKVREVKITVTQLPKKPRCEHNIEKDDCFVCHDKTTEIGNIS